MKRALSQTISQPKTTGDKKPTSWARIGGDLRAVVELDVSKNAHRNRANNKGLGG